MRETPRRGLDLDLVMAHALPMTPLAIALKEARGDRPQAYSAAAIGVAQTRISDWEKSKQKPDPLHYDAVARFLGFADADDGAFRSLIVRTELILAGARPGL